MSLFAKPNRERDLATIEREKEKLQGRVNFRDRYWKPKPNQENVIRILPQRADHKGDYFLKISKHFIRHADGTLEVFTCMRETYGEECSACERWLELVKAKNNAKVKDEKDRLTEEAKRYKPQRFGVFNILVRDSEAEEEAKVILWESPISVWTDIVGIISGHGRMSDVFDSVNDKAEIEKPGRDIIIKYDPDQSPMNKYTVIVDDRSPLGDPEHVLAWYDQITELLPENVAFRIEYDIAKIKTFGTTKEREELRELLKQIWLEQRKKDSGEDEEDDTPTEAEEEVKEQEPTKTEKKTTVKEKKSPKPVKKKEEESAPEEEEGDVLASLRGKLDEIKATQDKK